MNKISQSRHIAFKCIDCGTINVFPHQRGDGNVCMKCKGYIMPIGDAIVYTKNSISVDIKLDITKLDEALDKAREIAGILDRVK
jgi:DNA-directed RNA polymerase subunit RPC12/RpoP